MIGRFTLSSGATLNRPTAVFISSVTSRKIQCTCRQLNRYLSKQFVAIYYRNQTRFSTAL